MSLAACAPASIAAPVSAPTLASRHAIGHAPASPRHPDALRGCLDVELELRHAGMRQLRIAWECLGPGNAPVIFVAGGISAHRHVLASAAFPQAGWWQAQAGVGLDAGRTRIVAIDWLGADGTLDAPIDPADQADAIVAVLDALGIARLHAFVGCSYGAMVGLHFAARHAHRVARLVAISGAHRVHPYASAWRALQRQVVALGQLQCDEAQGLSLARQLAMLSYRTPEEFAARFAAAPTLAHARLRVASEDYLEACGANYVARTSPTAFLRLSESIDLHCIDPQLVRVPTTVVAVHDDRLVPIEDLHALVERLPDARLQVLHSKYGHDAFLKEPARIAAILRDAVQGACGGAA